MKKLFTILFMAVLVTSVVGCGGSKTPNISTNDTVDSISDVKETANNKTTSDQEESQTTIESEVIFEENTDLKVITAFIYDNYTYVVVENVGDKAILDYEFAFINFDNNGFITTTDFDGYELGGKIAANLMPGDKTITGWYGSSSAAKYATAVITDIVYADGTYWEANNINKWASDASASFSVKEYNDNLATMKETAVLAEKNEYAALTDYSIVYRNQFSTSYDLDFSIKNTSSQGITAVNIFVLEFDKNGFPVSVSPYDTYCLNGHGTGGTINLASGQSGNYTDDLFLEASTTQIKIVIFKLEFQDGTEWFNPYIYEWIVANNKAY